MEALPDLSETSKPISSLRLWHLCQVVTRHLWQRWLQEYLTNLQQFAKWNCSSPNINVGDIVCVGERYLNQPNGPLLGSSRSTQVLTERFVSSFSGPQKEPTHAQSSRLCHWSHRVTIPEKIITGKLCGFRRWYVPAQTA